MAARLDVPARLDDGRDAVSHSQSYVSACQRLGYWHPDLTVHDAQLTAWYDGETGLDLRVLDEDGVQLRAGLAAGEEALAIQRAQLGELAAAWTGAGADGAARFLQRHCETAAGVVAAIGAAAAQCATLTDTLWQLIDEKAAAVIDIDDRCCAQRAGWLAAAHAVTAGAGDHVAAAEIVEQQITPYVDHDIGADWLAVMRATRSAVAAAYDAATDRLAATVTFEMPGDFAPRYQSGPPGPAPVAPIVPVAAPQPPIDPVPATPAPLPPVDPVAAPLPAAAAEPAFGESPLGTQTPTDTKDLAGMLRQLIDAIDDPPADPEDEPDDLVLEDPVEDEPPENEPQADPEPAPPEPAPPEPEAPEQPVAAEKAPAEAAAPTPCEIAADELPQAGQ